MTICIDIDLDPSKRNRDRSIWYDMVRSLYQFSWIKRDVRKTKNGIHVYIDLPEPDTLDKYLVIKSVFGDDPRRVDLDVMRWGFMNVDICFKNNEVRE